MNSAYNDILPKMEASAFVLALMTENQDLYLALQIGMSLLLDKPLFLVVPNEAWIAPRLRGIAEAIIEGSLADPATGDKFRATIQAYLKKQAPQ